ncbi:MAG: type 2 isopentenyl-diphosphate Delta-isomerase, partial [Thermodesulfobacteriota bacterium]
MSSVKKDSHIHICLKGHVDGDISNGLEKYRFSHRALPEINLGEVDTRVKFMGKRLEAPILIAPMTGGSEQGKSINRTLARAAQDLGIAMAVGSQKIAIEEPLLAHTFEVRDVAPDILLFANLGAIQLNNGFGMGECTGVLEMIRADALMLHLNPLQEALQENGNCNFSGLLSKVEEVISIIDCPVILREVSCGISEKVAMEMVATGAAGIDVGGSGGTSWALVEGEVNNSQRIKRLARSFSSWGISTAESIGNVRAVDKKLPLIATGGIRTGVEIATAIVLGADVVGIARPLLPLAMDSVDVVVDYLKGIIEGLR